MSILIISEHPTLNEGTTPFSNGLWRYFKAMLSRVGIDPRECDWQNVFSRPAPNMFSFLQKGAKGSLAGLPFIQRGWYVRPEFASDIMRLESYVRRSRPNLILAVGDVPLTILTHQHAMKFSRGRITTSIPSFGNTKVLPCWHPRAVQADITQEPILLADLQKAKRESAFPEVRRPHRFLHLRPSIEDLESFWQEFIEPSSALSIDIETKVGITCFGVSPSPDRALVVPFYDEEAPDGNYWKTPVEESIAWDFVRRCCNTPGKAVFGQNLSYDVQYLWKMGIPVSQWTDDTMILHHALQPEMEKGLGFLASIYTDEGAWKQMVKHAASDRTAKKEDL